MPAGYVDDREPPVPQGDTRHGGVPGPEPELGGVSSLIVGTSMLQHPDHLPECFFA